MRSIGKRNIKKVKDLTLRVITGGLVGIEEVTEIVREELPVEFWDIWEGADSEINNIISDVVMESLAG